MSDGNVKIKDLQNKLQLLKQKLDKNNNYYNELLNQNIEINNNQNKLNDEINEIEISKIEIKKSLQNIVKKLKSIKVSCISLSSVLSIIAIICSLTILSELILLLLLVPLLGIMFLDQYKKNYEDFEFKNTILNKKENELESKMKQRDINRNQYYLNAKKIRDLIDEQHKVKLEIENLFISLRSEKELTNIILKQFINILLNTSDNSLESMGIQKIIK